MTAKALANSFARTREMAAPFMYDSWKYWEIVSEIIRLTGASLEDAEVFVQAQDACKKVQGS